MSRGSYLVTGIVLRESLALSQKPVIPVEGAHPHIVHELENEPQLRIGGAGGDALGEIMEHTDRVELILLASLGCGRRAGLRGGAYVG